MTDIMKLADGYASAQGDARADLGANAGMDEQDPMWIAMKEARAALQSAIEALQGEVAQVKGFWKEAQLRNRNLLEEGNDLAMLADQYKAERDKLQAKLDELAKQEPVAHFGSAYVNENGVHITTVLGPVAIPQDAKLYAAPKALEPLTEERIDELEDAAFRDYMEGRIDCYTYAVARAIEADHGITKGTP